MTKFVLGVILAAFIGSSPAMAAKLSAGEKAALAAAKAAEKAEVAALKAEWKEAKGFLIVKAAPGITRKAAHDALLAHMVEKGFGIVNDHELQITVARDLEETNPNGAMFYAVLAGDPRGGPVMSTVTFTFVESNDAPLRVRGCAIVGQANRFGGVVQGNCALSFGNWRQGRELITNVLSTLDPAKSEIAVDAPEGAQGQ